MTPKRRPGPKPKPASKRKDRLIGVRVTEAEYKKFERLARRQHITVAAWVRAQVHRAVESAPDDAAASSELEKARRGQEELLDKTKDLLKQTIRLYQSVPTKGAETPYEPGGPIEED